MSIQRGQILKVRQYGGCFAGLTVRALVEPEYTFLAVELLDEPSDPHWHKGDTVTISTGWLE